MFCRRGEYPVFNSESLLKYLDEHIQECRISSLEAKNENDEKKYLLYEGGRIAFETIKEDLLFSIENKIR